MLLRRIRSAVVVTVVALVSTLCATAPAAATELAPVASLDRSDLVAGTTGVPVAVTVTYPETLNPLGLLGPQPPINLVEITPPSTVATAVGATGFDGWEGSVTATGTVVFSGDDLAAGETETFTVVVDAVAASSDRTGGWTVRTSATNGVAYTAATAAAPGALTMQLRTVEIAQLAATAPAEVAGESPAVVTAGQDNVGFRTVVRNAGTSSRTIVVSIVSGEAQQVDHQATVAAGQSTTIDFSGEFPTAGTSQISVNASAGSSTAVPRVLPVVVQQPFTAGADGGLQPHSVRPGTTVVFHLPLSAAGDATARLTTASQLTAAGGAVSAALAAPTDVASGDATITFAATPVGTTTGTFGDVAAHLVGTDSNGAPIDLQVAVDDPLSIDPAAGRAPDTPSSHEPGPAALTSSAPTLSAEFNDVDGDHGGILFTIRHLDGAVVAGGSGTSTGPGGRSSWTVPAGVLGEGVSYTWSAVARDTWGEESSPSADLPFATHLASQLPTPPSELGTDTTWATGFVAHVQADPDAYVDAWRTWSAARGVVIPPLPSTNPQWIADYIADVRDDPVGFANDWRDFLVSSGVPVPPLPSTDPNWWAGYAWWTVRTTVELTDDQAPGSPLDGASWASAFVAHVSEDPAAYINAWRTWAATQGLTIPPLPSTDPQWVEDYLQWVIDDPARFVTSWGDFLDDNGVDVPDLQDANSTVAYAWWTVTATLSLGPDQAPTAPTLTDTAWMTAFIERVRLNPQGFVAAWRTWAATYGVVIPDPLPSTDPNWIVSYATWAATNPVQFYNAWRAFLTSQGIPAPAWPADPAPVTGLAAWTVSAVLNIAGQAPTNPGAYETLVFNAVAQATTAAYQTEVQTPAGSFSGWYLYWTAWNAVAGVTNVVDDAATTVAGLQSDAVALANYGVWLVTDAVNGLDVSGWYQFALGVAATALGLIPSVDTNYWLNYVLNTVNDALRIVDEAPDTALSAVSTVTTLAYGVVALVGGQVPYWVVPAATEAANYYVNYAVSAGGGAAATALALAAIGLALAMDIVYGPTVGNAVSLAYGLAFAGIGIVLGIVFSDLILGTATDLATWAIAFALEIALGPTPWSVIEIVLPLALWAIGFVVGLVF